MIFKKYYFVYLPPHASINYQNEVQYNNNKDKQMVLFTLISYLLNQMIYFTKD